MHRRNVQHEGATTTMSDPIPLTVLMLEDDAFGASVYGRSVAAFEQQITDAGHSIVIDYVGRVCVSRDTARALLCELRERQQAQREHAQEARLEAARHGHPVRQRVQALAEAGRASADLTAIQAMLAAESDDRMDVRGEVYDAMRHGRSEGARISPVPGPRANKEG